ncbi:MAG: hypothetical protein QW815_07605 [Nitrososphaerota archaeon]
MANKLYSIGLEQGWASIGTYPPLFSLHGGHVRFLLSTLSNPHSDATPMTFYAWATGQKHREVEISYSPPIQSNQRSRLYEVEVYGTENATWAGGGISTSLTFQVSSLAESDLSIYKSAYIIMQDRAAPTERWWYLYYIDMNYIRSGTYRVIVVYDTVPFLWRVMPPVMGNYPYPDYRFT